MTIIETLGAIIGLCSVWLTVRGNVWCWAWGIVSVLLYVGVFFRERLYADMALQLVFVGTNLYGWYEWKRGSSSHTGRVITRVSPQTMIVVSLLIVLYAGIAALFLRYFTNASLPELDAFLTSMSLAAVWMQARKYCEHWLVWIVADVLYVGMFLWKALWLTAALYAVFTVMAFIGYREWNKELRNVQS